MGTTSAIHHAFSQGLGNCIKPPIHPPLAPVHSYRFRVLWPGYVVAQRLGITSHLVSRLTGCLLLEPGGGVRTANGGSNIVGELEDARSSRDARFNCAIEIKHNKKNEEVGTQWSAAEGQSIGQSGANIVFYVWVKLYLLCWLTVICLHTIDCEGFGVPFLSTVMMVFKVNLHDGQKRIGSTEEVLSCEMTT